jgi:hypothetical protein
VNTSRNRKVGTPTQNERLQAARGLLVNANAILSAAIRNAQAEGKPIRDIDNALEALDHCLCHVNNGMAGFNPPPLPLPEQLLASPRTISTNPEVVASRRAAMGFPREVDGRVVIDEACSCGALRSEHAALFLMLGRGSCRRTGCKSFDCHGYVEQDGTITKHATAGGTR